GRCTCDGTWLRGMAWPCGMGAHAMAMRLGEIVYGNHQGLDDHRRSPIPPAEHLTWTKPKGLEKMHVRRHVATGGWRSHMVWVRTP
ncbi:MAG: hypothetical protein AAFO96_07595, partial [Bacteroidota bacterium]